MSRVYQRVMSDGDWEINLSPTCPRAILDKMVPFTTHVVITPGEIPVTSTDAVFLAAARYVGVLRRLGRNRLSPGGPAPSMWMSDPDGKGRILTTRVEHDAGSLSTWTTSLISTAGTGLTVGTVTSPGGTFTNVYQWVSARDAFNSVCRAFGVEWRVNSNFTVDVGTVGTLYRNVADGDTPTVVVARNMGGRDPQVVGIRADLETSIDWEDYVSQVIVLGNGTNAAGFTSPFRRPTGSTFIWARVVLDPTTPNASLASVATAVLDQLQSDEAGRRELRVSTDLFDVSGDVTLGDDVWVWDPDNGIVDTTQQTHYQGQLIYPAVLRCLGIHWPVRRGMGVYLRIQNGTGTPTYENISPYVEFSEGAAELELGAGSRLVRVDSAGQISEVTGQVKAAPWNAYTPTWTSAGTPPAIGNGTLEGRFRRDGTTLHLRIRMRSGTTTTYGSANGWTFSLPSGMTAYTGTDHYQMLDGFTSVSGVGNFRGGGYVTTGATVVTAAVTNVAGTYGTISGVTNTIPGTWPASTAGSFVEINGTIEVAP